MSTIICFILGIAIGSLILENQNKKKCYKDSNSDTTKACTGDGCEYRHSCKLYQNYLNDE